MQWSQSGTPCLAPSRAKATRRAFPSCGHPSSGDSCRILATSPPKLPILLFFSAAEPGAGPALPADPGSGTETPHPPWQSSSGSSPEPQPPARGAREVHGFTLLCCRASAGPAPSWKVPGQMASLPEPPGGGERGWAPPDVNQRRQQRGAIDRPAPRGWAQPPGDAAPAAGAAVGGCSGSVKERRR